MSMRTEIKYITLEDIEILEEILNYKKASTNEVVIMENFAKKYIDNKFNICRNCPAQIRFAHQRITSFYNINSSFITEKKESFLKVIDEPIIINEVRKCTKCDNILDTEVQDKRIKICNNCKNGTEIIKK